MNCRSRIIFFLIACCMAFTNVWAQSNKEINSLKSQRAKLQKKITQNEGMLKSLKKDVRSQLSNLNVLNGQISTQKKYIDAISADVNALDGKITVLKAQLDTLKSELEQRKKHYRRAMLYLYRNRNTQNKLMFIFSADNFTQMLRRLRYVREYARYQRVQGELVKRKQEQVDAKHTEVIKTRDQKTVLLHEGINEQSKLEGQHAERTKIVNGLQKKQRQVQSAIKADKKRYSSLNSKIDALIQQQILAEKKRREEARKRELERQKKIAKQKAREEAKRKQLAAAQGGKENNSDRQESKSRKEKPVYTPKQQAEDMKVFKMEEADKALSNDFAANKGRLPMPISGGYMITQHYGVHNVDGLSGVQLDNKGINITGKSGAQARAIFDGEVSAIFSLGGFSNVIVRHGSYISVYCNLSSVSVGKGQKVRTKQTLGSVARDASGNCTLHFQLRRETSKLNPEAWLAK